MVGARHAPRAAPALMRLSVRVRVVGEVAGTVGVQLGGQLTAAASEQQPAPERVVLVPAAEGVQLDRLQRQHQRLLRVRAAQDRRLDLPPVTPHETPPFIPTHRATQAVDLTDHHRAHAVVRSGAGSAAAAGVPSCPPAGSARARRSARARVASDSRRR